MKKLLISLGVVVVLAVAWYLLSPLFLNTVVDEQLPFATGLTDTEKGEMEKIESLTPQQVQSMPEEERMEAKRTMEELGQKMPDAVMDEPMESQPVAELSGSFKDGDSFHRGSGKATIYTLPDGKRVLRFEDFTVTNGPALSVYLVRSQDGNVNSGFVDLGKLKGNKGNQNYDIAADVDLGAYKSVVIWCVPFGVMFATASLQ
ncbi:MAG: DM13 domain-containing protein [Candidatus Peribacteraceae bacterium]|nr:DM13 domain-containing protein [Candidatus Peribacteraceae bacterium]